MINFILGLEPSTIFDFRTDLLEKEFVSIYKPLAKFLLSNEKFKMFFSFTGPQFEYYKKKHNEFIDVIKKLIDRGQVEVLGGGYYNPIFPFLFLRDRTSQLELLSSAIRETLGKRPRGSAIFESAWDASLVSTFSSCSIEYVFLDENLIAQEKNNFIPFVMSDKGKTITILPIENSLKPEIDFNVDDYFEKITEKIKKAMKTPLSKNVFFAEKCVSHIFSHKDVKFLMQSGFFESFLGEIKNETSNFNMKTPSQYLKDTTERQMIYISSGVSENVAKWSDVPYKKSKNTNKTIFDFIQTYPKAKALYNKLIWTSTLLTQTHGDKTRKKVAMDKLLESQNGFAFFYSSETAEKCFLDSRIRQISYKKLEEAEKLYRDCDDFSESVSVFDYNGDGKDEYIFRMGNYFSVLDLYGGKFSEFDVVNTYENYADNFSRLKEFDGQDDNYERGLFVDNFWTDDEFSDFLKSDKAIFGIPNENNFSCSVYSEKKFISSRKELQLFSERSFKKNIIHLTKKIIANSNGLMVQYIIKNEGKSKIDGKFVVEQNFSENYIDEKTNASYKIDVLSDSQKLKFSSADTTKDEKGNDFIKNVESFYLTNAKNNVSFIFEVNENCNLMFSPVKFLRPDASGKNLCISGQTFSCILFWELSLEAGMESEKTINLTIFNQKKRGLGK